jgi:hypothetical protein
MPQYKGRMPLGSSRQRWEDNIEMDVKEVGFIGFLVKTTTGSIKYEVS